MSILRLRFALARCRRLTADRFASDIMIGYGAVISTTWIVGLVDVYKAPKYSPWRLAIADARVVSV